MGVCGTAFNAFEKIIGSYCSSYHTDGHGSFTPYFKWLWEGIYAKMGCSYCDQRRRGRVVLASAAAAMVIGLCWLSEDR